MRTAETKCQFCQAVVIAQWPDYADPEAVDRFFKMLACNPCADNRRIFKDTQDSIFQRCFEFDREGVVEKEKLRERVKASLVLLTRGYAKSCAYIFKAPQVIWAPEFVELLMEQPDKVGRILYNYREEVRRTARQQTLT